MNVKGLDPLPMPVAPFFRGLLALFVVSALWSTTFISVAILRPDAIDPLLGGLHLFLYGFALIWLIVSLFCTHIFSFLFKKRTSNKLFISISLFITVAPVFLFFFFGMMYTFYSFDQPGNIWNGSLTDVLIEEALAAVQTIGFVLVACSVKIFAFLAAGGTGLLNPRAGQARPPTLR